jgi:hypothetical protein
MPNKSFSLFFAFLGKKHEFLPAEIILRNE